MRFALAIRTQFAQKTQFSVRATNVYEEKSLGVYQESPSYDELNDDAHWNRPTESRVAIWGKYLVRHARRQLSFGTPPSNGY